MAIENVDPEISELIKKEETRQKENIELIASENFVSDAVLEAAGSVLTNKYAEGYPMGGPGAHGRYYGGCFVMDEIEDHARERLKKLFGAEHANVQPHAGSQANAAVYFALLNPGDTILSMNLDDGGHLTHGSPVNFSGKTYNFVHYGVDGETGEIDYEKLREKALETKPKMILCGASAYSRTIDFKRIKEIADEVGSYTMADIAHIAGLIVAGDHPSPFPYFDVVTTTTHKTLRGPRGGAIMCKAELAKKIDKAIFPGTQGGPLMHIIAAKAVAFKEAMSDEFKEYQHQIVRNANALAETLKAHGFKIVSGGTDNHLMLVDLRNKGMTGKEAQELFEEVNITLNKNMIPSDPEKPTVTSGVRIGTPAVTTRGMKEEHMKIIADLINETVENRDNEEKLAEIREKVRTLCNDFPLHA